MNDTDFNMQIRPKDLLHNVFLNDPVSHLVSKHFHVRNAVRMNQLIVCCDLALQNTTSKLASQWAQYTHPFNGSLSGTTQVSQYQKGKTNLDFTEARDIEWQWHQLGHMHACTSLQTDNHASTPPLTFLQAGCPSRRQKDSTVSLCNKWYNAINNNLWLSWRPYLEDLGLPCHGNCCMLMTR